ncbi:MAG: Ig-like domain-containing protein, partial [Candidatus Subteraquimicrobiales bacterium]|nr:Ig-like domain-containing protein [Candidatus Subteraquimicrobiales bacterium]
WTQPFTITDAGEEITGVDIAVSGATDLAGNTQGSKITVDLFNVDTKNPTGTITIGTATISDSDLVQEVTVSYDEEMSATPAPTITFSGGTTWTAVTATGAWNTVNTVWTQSFTITDAGEEITGVTVTSSGAKDVAGNTEGAGTPAMFAVDTKNPTVAVTSTTANGAYNEGDQINVTLTFSENITSTGDITVTLNTGGTCVIPQINTAINTATCNYVVQAGDTSSDLAVNSIAGTIIDASGNATSLTPTSNISNTSNIVIDTTAPANFTVGTVTTTGGTVVSGKWNSTNTGINVIAPIADDGSLVGGTIQLQAKITGGTFTDLGSAVSIPSVNTTQTVSISDTDFEKITGFADDKTVTITAIITDTAGNPTTGTESATTIYIDQTVPVVTVDKLTTNDSTPQLTGTIDDSSAIIQVTVNSVNYTAIISGNAWTANVTTALVDGTYDVAVAATDPAGNTGSDATSNELVIDTQIPTITELYPIDSS